MELEGAPAQRYESAADLFRALGNPRRLAILGELQAGPLCVHELVDALDLPQPLVSQHLRVLRSADLLRSERRGREALYHLADDHVHHIVSDALAHVAEHDHQPPAIPTNEPLEELLP